MSWVLRPAEELAVVETPRRFAILNLRRLADPPVCLEGPAATLWGGVDAGHSEEELVELLELAYEVSPLEARAAVASFTAELIDAGFAVRHPS